MGMPPGAPPPPPMHPPTDPVPPAAWRNPLPRTAFATIRIVPPLPPPPQPGNVDSDTTTFRPVLPPLARILPVVRNPIAPLEAIRIAPPPPPPPSPRIVMAPPPPPPPEPPVKG